MKRNALLFTALIVYSVFQLHYPLETGIPSVTLLNLLFILALGALLSEPDAAPMTTHRAYLKPALVLFLGAITLAFAISLAQGGGNRTMAIATYYKNALFFPLFYFLALRSRLDAARTRQMIVLILIVAAVGSLQAVRQGLDYGLANYHDARRASGPFGDDWRMSNRAGVYFAMYVPMFTALALMLKGWKLRRLAAVAAVPLVGLAIMFTYSRQSYGIALVGFALILLRRNLVLAAIMLAAMVSLATYLPDSVTDRVTSTEQRDAAGGTDVDISTASRWIIWGGGLRMWEEHPMGVGLAHFGENIGTYVPAFRGKDAHNFYVLTLCESGALGLLALLYLILRLFMLAVGLRRAAPPGDDEANALTGGFVVMVLCMAMGNLYGSAFFEGEIMGVFWLLCGFLERYFALRGHAAAPAEPVAAGDPAAQMAARYPLAARAAGIANLPSLAQDRRGARTRALPGAAAAGPERTP
ncbi:MAG: O-antigen ligase family protein [Rhodanobacteraceae bacterium]|jgi:hypothetical protein|nr:O-antigen ligase family protein [Rhodanobacteraceae bacterium]